MYQKEVDLTKLLHSKAVKFSSLEFKQDHRFKLKAVLKQHDFALSESFELLKFFHKATLANVKKNDNTTCSYSREYLAKRFKVSAKTITTSIKTLEHFKLVDVIRDKKRGKSTSTNIYILRYENINKLLKTKFPASAEEIVKLREIKWGKNNLLTRLSKDNINNKLIHKYTKQTIEKSDKDKESALYQKCGTLDRRQLYKDKVVRARLSASQYVKAAQSLSSRIRMLQLYKDNIKITQFSSFTANRVSMKALEKEINERSNKYFTFDTDYLSAVRFNTNVVNNELFDFKRFIEDTIDDLSSQLVKVKNIYNEVTDNSYSLEDFKFKVCKEVTEKEFLERNARKQASTFKSTKKQFVQYKTNTQHQTVSQHRTHDMQHKVHNQTTQNLQHQISETKWAAKEAVTVDLKDAMAEAMAAIHKLSSKRF